MFRSYKFKNSIEKCKKKPGKSCFAVRKEWVNIKVPTHAYVSVCLCADILARLQAARLELLGD